MSDAKTDPYLVETEAGLVRGLMSGGRIGVWRGIPYAAPPIGDQRWRAPVAPKPWTGVRECFSFGEACRQPQPTFMTGQRGFVGSEDCLFLNIWRPAGSGIAPVMVWLHGGGNVMGNGNINPDLLVATQNVVVVSLNYRLGPLGWLRHRALRAEATSEREASGNFGILDICFALQWVQRNIRAFGGDPRHVTLFGTSGGGWNVRGLITSPLAKGLFHRAIIQGSALKRFTTENAENYSDDADAPGHPQSANELALEMIAGDHGAASRAAARKIAEDMPNAAMATYLRSKTLEQIDAAYTAIGVRPEMRNMPHEDLDTIKVGSLGSSWSAPKLFADGVVLSKDPEPDDLKQVNVPLIVGTTRDEDKCFLAVDPDVVDRSPGQFCRIKNTQIYEEAAKALSGLYRAAGVDETADRLSRLGKKVYTYRFDWDEQPIVDGIPFAHLNGAMHGLMNAFLVGSQTMTTEPTICSAEIAINNINRPGFECVQRALMEYWGAFAHTGAPGRGRHGREAEWRQHTFTSDAKPLSMIFDTESEGGVRLDSVGVSRQQVVDMLLKLVDQDPIIGNAVVSKVLEYFMQRLGKAERATLLQRISLINRGSSPTQYAHS